jgi:S1-C subfamily serine protease
MKKLTLAMALLVLAVPAFAGGGEKCSADLQTCLNHHAAMKDKGWTGLELDKSDPAAIKVKAVTAGSPAAKAGFLVGDVLVAMNGVSMTDKEAMKKAKGEWKVGQAVTYTVKRKNADKQLAVTLAAMPEAAYASMVGTHLLANHVTAATAATTEATPATATTTDKTDK